MKLLNKIFNKYVLLLKKVTTFAGTTIIYCTAILLGKILYSFSPKIKSNHWSNFESGSSPFKMF
jgi:hypothetical protein